MSRDLIIQAIVSGLLMGLIYALVAVGLSLIFGLMEIVNFAHGEFLMLAMFAAFWFWALGGLDPLLREMHEDYTGAPAFSHDSLREHFASEGGAMLAQLWEEYVERGRIPYSEVDDPTYREFVFTPQRENYVKMLRWLTPAYKKSAIGDYEGAIYCANRALEFRAEPKDFLLIADLSRSRRAVPGAHCFPAD